MSVITSTVRPVATLRSRLAIVHGAAATIDVAVADNDDTTFVRQTAVTGFSKVQFAPLALPVGAVVQTLTLRLRLTCAAATTLSAQLNTGPAIPFTPHVGTFRTDSSAPQAGFSLQAVENGVSVTWTAGGQLDVAEAYLDVTYVERPDVAVLTPAGTVTESQPEITWNADTPLGQSNFQAKVYTQDQYTAPGFNPNTSSAFYDSGIQVGNDDSIVPSTINLINGQTYRFYVRIAQLVAGAPQWSAWAFSTATLSAPVPDVPTLAAEPDNELARIKLTLTDGFTPPPPGTGYGLGPYGSGPYGGSIIGGAWAGAAGPGTWQFVTVQRSSDGGVTWLPVRSATRAQVFGTEFVVYDYEACNGVDVQYRGQAIAVAGSGDVASDWTTPSAPVHWSSALTWLKSPTLPAVNTPVRINELPTLTRRQPQGAFDVENRPDPVIVSDARKLPSGTVTFVTLEGPERDAINLLLNRSEPLLLQTPPEDDFGCAYISIGDVDENRVVKKSRPIERLVVCPFQTVLAPAGDIVGTGATWQTVIGRYGTWNDLAAANATWAALLEIGA